MWSRGAVKCATSGTDADVRGDDLRVNLPWFYGDSFRRFFSVGAVKRSGDVGVCVRPLTPYKVSAEREITTATADIQTETEGPAGHDL